MADHPPTDRPPLWLAMRRADASCASDFSSSEARMMRAIADELVLHFDPCLTEHEAVAEWLHHEADRAERGEGSNG